MAKKTNRPKGEINFDEKPKKDKASKKVKSSMLSNFNSDKIRIGFGLTLIFSALILLIAFTSYLVTGNYDQNLLSTGVNDLGTAEIRNWLGKFGAVISQKFIGDWFGIAAFIITPILFRLGIKALFKFTLVKSKTVFKYSIFTLLWLPPFLAYFFQSDATIMLGGGVGLSIINHLNLAIGSIGSLMVLLFVLAAVILINFDIPLDAIFTSDKAAPSNLDEDNVLKETPADAPLEEFEIKLKEDPIPETVLSPTPIAVLDPIPTPPVEILQPMDEIPLEVNTPVEPAAPNALDTDFTNIGKKKTFHFRLPLLLKRFQL